MSNSYERKIAFAPRAKSISTMNCKIPVINRLKRNQISDLKKSGQRKSRVPDSFESNSYRKLSKSPISGVRNSSWR